MSLDDTSSNENIISILDVGCGNGKLIDSFAFLGHSAFGIEPQTKQPKTRTENGAEIHRGVAEDLPFPDQHFDLVIFGHSLHHVPLSSMSKALSEALRVLKPNGRLFVAEPLDEGPFHHVMQPVDDEAPLYEAVKQALTAVVADGLVILTTRTYIYAEPSYKTVGHVKAALVRVDPQRAKAPASAWEEFNRRFQAQPKSWFFGKRKLKHFSRVDLFQKQ